LSVREALLRSLNVGQQRTQTGMSARGARRVRLVSGIDDQSTGVGEARVWAETDRRARPAKALEKSIVARGARLMRMIWGGGAELARWAGEAGNAKSERRMRRGEKDQQTLARPSYRTLISDEHSARCAGSAQVNVRERAAATAAVSAEGARPEGFALAGRPSEHNRR